MLFNSLEFLVFFALFLGLWPLLRRGRNTRWAYLTAASLFFYGWWDWRYLFLLVGTGLIDYGAGLGMAAWPRWRKALLLASMGGNIGTLALFKYLDFGLTNANGLLHWLGCGVQLPLLHLTLPVGISFYTFQSMSYTIDVYRGELRPTRNVLHFFAFLSLFPQLVAGPIIRAADLLPQLLEVRRTTEEQRWAGLQLVVGGYFKKVVIADGLAPLVDVAFGDGTPTASGAYWWVVTAMFACQIYCDFSGYSDIARGLAKWMGYEFMVNFDHPYVATSFREFWARWHISLSTWFRDYVYIPLGGSRQGPGRAQLNMWFTMLASGLWHGASWTFVGWGVLHAAFLSLERVTRLPQRLSKVPGGRVLSWAVTLVGVLVAWVFFRAESLSQALAIVGAMFSPSVLDLAPVKAQFHWRALVLVALVVLRHAWFFPTGTWTWTPPAWLRWPLRRVLAPATVALVVWCCVYLRGPGHAFIYFQF